MLVLTRKIGESIMIGDLVEITILENHSNEVKVGIKAPKSIVILRKEIFEAVKKENKEAANALPNSDRLREIAKKLDKG